MFQFSSSQKNTKVWVGFSHGQFFHVSEAELGKPPNIREFTILLCLTPDDFSLKETPWLDIPYFNTRCGAWSIGINSLNINRHIATNNKTIANGISWNLQKNEKRKGHWQQFFLMPQMKQLLKLFTNFFYCFLIHPLVPHIFHSEIQYILLLFAILDITRYVRMTSCVGSGKLLHITISGLTMLS